MGRRISSEVPTAGASTVGRRCNHMSTASIQLLIVALAMSLGMFFTLAGTAAATGGAAAVGWGWNNPSGETGAGYDSYGPKGNGYPASSEHYEGFQELNPTSVVGLPAGSEIKQMIAPTEWSAALLTNGQVWTWGWGEGFGEGNYATNGLGTGNTNELVTPGEVVEEPKAGEQVPIKNVTAIAGTGSSGMALLSSGEVVTWGHSWYGERGTGEFGSAYTQEQGEEGSPTRSLVPLIKVGGKEVGGVAKVPRDVATIVTPIKEKLEADEGKVVKIAMGNGADFVVIELPSGVTEVMAWGEDGEGMLGTGSATPPEECPHVEAAKEKITKGEALGTVPCSIEPVAVDLSLEAGEKVTQISAGGRSAYVVSNNHKVWAWGSNRNGELGKIETAEEEAHTEDRFDATPTVVSMKPVEEELKTTVSPTSVAAGGEFVLATLSSGKVIGWGANEEGQLSGTSTYSCYKKRTPACQPLPRLISGFEGASSLAAGWDTSFAVKSGHVYAVGVNGVDEQLGAEAAYVESQPCTLTVGDPKGSEPAEVREREQYESQVEHNTCARTVALVKGVPSGVLSVVAGNGESLELQHDFAVLETENGPRPQFTVKIESKKLTVEGFVPELAEKEVVPPFPLVEADPTLEAKEETYGVRWASVGAPEVGKLGMQEKSGGGEGEWIEKKYKAANGQCMKTGCKYEISSLPHLTGGRMYMIEIKPGGTGTSYKYSYQLWANPKE